MDISVFPSVLVRWVSAQTACSALLSGAGCRILWFRPSVLSTGKHIHTHEDITLD